MTTTENIESGKSSWRAFLLTQGGSVATPAPAHAPAPVVSPVPSASPIPVTGIGSLPAAVDELDIVFAGAGDTRASFVAPLTDLGLIAATGEDAAKFLHGQLTNDVENLKEGDVRLAGYCTPKGRLMATMTMWKSGATIWLSLPRQIQPAIQKRLQMFIMRAKAKLADGAMERVVLGLAGPDVPAAIAPWFASLPAGAWASLENEHGALLRLADAGGADGARYQWILPVELAMQVWPRLTASLAPRCAAAWRLLDIEAGIPQVLPATQEQFVPQMINYEALGGVNFRKGCYPGQEIVARSQYLGKLKRRTSLASLAAGALAEDGRAPAAGMEVYSSADPTQPCGMLVNAEAAADGAIACLVELKIAALDAGGIHLGSAAGPQLTIRALPYTIPEPD